MASKDLYGVLGVARDAESDVIRKRYRELARKLHPDVNPGDEAAETRFKEVSAAYAVLSDAKKRKLYDTFGDVALQAGFDEEKAERLRQFGGGGGFDYGGWSQNFASGGGIEEILGGLFGGRGFGGRGRGRRRPAPTRGADIETELPIDLPLSVRGGKTSVRLSLPGREHVELTIPPGVRDGQSLRLRGLGQAGQQGGSAGDLRVKIRVLKHSSYRREGDNLHVEVPITLQEAVEGAPVTFQGPTGEVTIKVPAGTQSGQSFRLRGLGAKEGHLYAHVSIASPELDENAPEEARERLLALAQDLQALYETDLRAKVRF